MRNRLVLLGTIVVCAAAISPVAMLLKLEPDDGVRETVNRERDEAINRLFQDPKVRELMREVETWIYPPRLERRAAIEPTFRLAWLSSSDEDRKGLALKWTALLMEWRDQWQEGATEPRAILEALWTHALMQRDAEVAMHALHASAELGLHELYRGEAAELLQEVHKVADAEAGEMYVRSYREIYP